MARPKGSKNKPKAIVVEKIAVEIGSESNINEDGPSQNGNSERESDQDEDSEDDSDAETVVDELNSFGEVVFEENDVYGPLFCKVAALPQSEIRLTNEIKDAIKKSLGKLSREYLKDPCDKSLFKHISLLEVNKRKENNK